MTIAVFEKTRQTTQVWLKELSDELGWKDEQKAYVALRSTLQALRDRLTIEEAVELGAQLPMLVRGFYYEGWTPSGKPVKVRHKDEFLQMVLERAGGDPWMQDGEAPVRAVFGLLQQKIAGGEIEDVKRVLPEDLVSLWPEEAGSPRAS